MGKKNNSLKRELIANLQPRKITLIVVEGIETEYNYLQQWVAHLKLTNVKIIAGKHSDPLGVITSAEVVSKKNKYDQVFCVIDGERNQEKNYQDALKKAKSNKFEVIVSIPCFEFWFLLHLTYSTKPYNSCNEVIKDLKIYPEFQDYQKSSEVFKILKDKCPQAIENAIKLQQYHKKIQHDNELDIFVNSNPITKVNVLIEYLHDQKNFT